MPSGLRAHLSPAHWSGHAGLHCHAVWLIGADLPLPRWLAPTNARRYPIGPCSTDSPALRPYDPAYQPWLCRRIDCGGCQGGAPRHVTRGRKRKPG